MEDLYYTIARQGSGKVNEKMSRFLSFAVPVASAAEARDIVKKYQNDYHDARHVCWAYMIGPDRDEWQLNDNGEPSGTAGKPILGQINSLGLTDVLVLVVRYFGGIKLGTSGLISAYREAALEALQDAGKVEKYRSKTLDIIFPYLAMNEVMKIAKGGDVEILSQQFDNSCRMTLRMRSSMYPSISQRILSIDGVTLP